MIQAWHCPQPTHPMHPSTPHRRLATCQLCLPSSFQRLHGNDVYDATEGCKNLRHFFLYHNTPVKMRQGQVHIQKQWTLELNAMEQSTRDPARLIEQPMRSHLSTSHLPQGLLESLNIDLVVEVVHIPQGNSTQHGQSFKLLWRCQTIWVSSKVWFAASKRVTQQKSRRHPCNHGDIFPKMGCNQMSLRPWCTIAGTNQQPTLPLVFLEISTPSDASQSKKNQEQDWYFWTREIPQPWFDHSIRNRILDHHLRCHLTMPTLHKLFAKDSHHFFSRPWRSICTVRQWNRMNHALRTTKPCATSLL